MAVSVKVDYSAFRARLDAMKRRGHDARAAFVLAMGSNFLQTVVKIAPVDTRRYVRGWLEAGRQAGMATSALPSIIPSKKRDEIVGVLSKQVIMLMRKRESLMRVRHLWYEQGNRPKRGYYHKLSREIERTSQRVEKAEEQLRRYTKTEGSLVMMRGTGAALNGYQKGLSDTAVNLTVRDKVYGGRGRLGKGTNKAALMLHNLEPHCRVVEKYRRVVYRANMVLKAGGVRRLKGVYVNTVATGARDSQRARWFGGGKAAS